MADDIELPKGAFGSQKQVSWTERQVVTFFESGGSQPYPRVWLTSDVHVDREENMEWVRALEPHLDDALVLAGDVSQSFTLLEETLRLFAHKFKRVFFTPGNHDLWVPTAERATTPDSLSKLKAIQEMCSRIGVSMEPELLRGDLADVRESLGTASRPGLWIVRKVHTNEHGSTARSRPPAIKPASRPAHARCPCCHGMISLSI